MKQHILRALFSLAILAIPAVLQATEPEQLLQSESFALDEVQISVKGNQIQVNGAQGLTLEVFDITGKRITSLRIDSPEKNFTLNLRKGCYILRVGKLARKISLS